MKKHTIVRFRDASQGQSQQRSGPILVLSWLLSTFFCLGMISSAQAVKAPSTNETPASAYVAIIIDDLGYKLKHDQRALELPGQVTYAFLPHTPQLKPLAKNAHAQGKEIMLHLPMQSVEPQFLGPGALTQDMSREAFKISVLKSILSVPHVKGVNNHMGSLITSQKTRMKWLMEEIARTRLFFVDSRTTTDTLAEATAKQYNIANTRRNIFLDHEHSRQAIEYQFNQLIKLARKKGTAVAIGHPYPDTLEVLEEKIPQLEAAGIHLIPVSELIQKQYLISKAQKKLPLHKSNALTQNNVSIPYTQ